MVTRAVSSTERSSSESLRLLRLLLRLLEGLRGGEGGTEVVRGREESALLSFVVLTLEYNDIISASEPERQQLARP